MAYAQNIRSINSNVQAYVQDTVTRKTKYLGTVKTREEAEKLVQEAKNALENGLPWESLQAKPHPSKSVTFRGVTKTAKEWIKHLNVTHQAVSKSAKKLNLSIPDEILRRLKEKTLPSLR